MLRRIDAKKERRKKFWMGAILVFLMAFSMMGIFTNNPGDQEWEYNDYKFTVQDNFYVAKIDGERMGFNFLPQALEEVPVPETFNERLQSPMIYLTFDPTSSIENLYYTDIVRNDFEQTLNTILVSAKTKESESYVLPIITCDNATLYVPVLYFNVSNETSIVQKNNCFVLNGQQIEFFKLRDLVVYQYFGVMDD